MGLFSSKYITSVGTSVSRIVVDKQVPDPIHTGAVKAITVSGDLVDYVLEEMAASVGIKVGSMYRYAKANYANGLPSGQYVRADAGQSQIRTTLSSIEGSSVAIEYSHYGPPNSKHIAWSKLISNYDYDTVSNEIKSLSVLKGFKVYLDSLQVVIPTSYLTTLSPNVLAQWGTPDNVGYTPERTVAPPFTKNSAIIVDSTATEDFYRISYIWEDIKTVVTTTVVNGVSTSTSVVTKTIMKEFLLLPITGFNDKDNYFHVKYSVGGVSKYWMYESGKGTYPNLDNLFKTPQLAGGSFFPMSYVRFNKKDMSTDKTTEEYRTTKKLMKYIGMDFDSIAEAVNTNPDIKNVEQAIISLAVPAVTNNPIECRYLFDFFASLHASTGTAKYSAEMDAWRHKSNLGNTTSSNVGTIVIQDKKFKMQLKHTGIYRTFGVGKKCKVGSYTFAEKVFSTHLEYNDDAIIAGKNTRPTNTSTTTGKYHYYFKQITEFVYEQIQVTGLTMEYFILDGYTFTAGESSPVLMVPLDYSITKDYSIQDETILYSRSLHFIFNSKQVQELKWYQQKWFSYVLLIIAIVWTIFSWGSDGGSAIGAAMASGTITVAAVMQVILIVVMQLVISYAVKLFVKVVGVKWAVVAALVAAYYGVVAEPGTLIGPLSMTAAQMLNLAVSLASTAIGADINDKFNTLKQDISAFEKQKEKDLKLLETADELLNNRRPFTPMFVMGETPDDYFNRTAHSGNIGLTTIGMVSSYVDMALRLPTVNQSNQTLMRYT